MITGLLVSIGIVACAAWLVLMFIWWQKEQNQPPVLASSVAQHLIDRGIRIIRRGWYACGMHVRSLGAWGGKKIRAAFLSLFPSAAPAFAPRDATAGLSEGPTSYFLLSISESEKEAQKSASQKKKTV